MPESFLDETGLNSAGEIFKYTNTVLNVGNFIPAAQKSGLAGEVLNIDSSEALMKIDSDLNALRAQGAGHVVVDGSAGRRVVAGGIVGRSIAAGRAPRPARSIILDIDLDFFAPEMDYIDNEFKLVVIKKLMSLADVVTIATSPFFIEQNLAINWLKRIM